MEESTDAKPKKSKYPFAIFFIAGFELLQRLCLFWMRTILLLYLVQQLGFPEDFSTMIYHSFNVVLFATPIFGGIIADNWLGRFKTLLIGSLVYGMGIVMMFISSIPGVLGPAILTFMGLFLAGCGNGVLAPCVAVFGGDQFVCPDRRNRQQKFFPVYYVLMSLASAIASFFSPILRARDCLGMDSCYPLSFGISTTFIMLAIGIFVAGKSCYIIKGPEGNVLVQVIKCVVYAIRKKIKNRKNMAKKQHWLDFAGKKFDQKFISDIKLGYAVWKMFLTVPFFWALYDQKGSRWTFQASRMDCDFDGRKVFPDQIQLLSPLLLITMIPIFELLLFPLLKKLNILQTPLKKMVLGGTLAAVAFLVSAGVELAIDPTDPIIPYRKEAQLRLFNALDCPISVSSNLTSNILTREIDIEPYLAWQNLHLPVKNFKTVHLKVRPGEQCAEGLRGSEFNIDIYEEQAQSYVFAGENTLEMSDRIIDSPRKSQKGYSKVRLVMNANMRNVPVILNLSGKRSGSKYSFFFTGEISVSEIKELENDEYDVQIAGVNNIQLGSVVFGTGGVYTMVLNEEKRSFAVTTITPENYVSVLWLIPQYFLMACSEILYAITGLGFAFSQSPKSMKTMIMSGLLTSVAFGNVIVIAISGAQICKDAVWEILIYAGIMFLCMIVFSIQAMWYQYAVIPPEDDFIMETNGKDGSSAKKNKEAGSVCFCWRPHRSARRVSQSVGRWVGRAAPPRKRDRYLSVRVAAAPRQHRLNSTHCAPSNVHHAEDRISRLRATLPPLLLSSQVMSGQRGSSSMPCGGLCHVLWGLCYVAAGAVQLVAGLFALKWLPVLGLGTNIVSGSWNLLAGITCALIAGLATELNAGRLNALLCISISVLAVDAVNLAILELYEWPFLVTKADQDIIKQRSMEKLVCYARLSTSVSSFLIVIIALLDTHISFCVLHNRKTSKRRAETNNAAPDPILNDMEYILPRRPTNLDDDDDEEQHHLTSNPNSAQAWVFDTGPIGGCATEVKTRLSTDEPLSACNRPNTYLLSRTPQQSNKVVVKLEVPAYEDRTSLNFMRSFSRTPSPTCSLSHPIYESVDKRTATVSPRARLYTADYAYAKHHRPGSSTDTARTHRRSESCDTRPHSVSSFHPPTVASSTAATPSGKYQYASLMMELEQAIQNKKDGDEEGSPVGSGSTDPSTLKDNSDTEFSKELEAALQMLQDLGSPNTIETPSEPSRSITTMPPPAMEMKKLAVVHEGRSSRASSSGYSSPTLTGSLSHLFPPPPPPLPGAVGSSSCSIQRRDDNSTVITVNSAESAESNAVSTVDLNPDPVSDFFKIGTWGTGTNNSRTSSGIGHDLENALLQTESLACLSELELLARHCRQKAEQRQIERKVQRQMSIRASSMRDALKKTLPSYSVDGYQVKESPA